MTQIEQIQTLFAELTPAEKHEIFDWLEDQFELTDEFKEAIQRGQEDLRQGRCRIVKPDQNP